MSVSVNPPKTPVTEGSSGVAAATLPNVCKMPGPPAPFVPTPLPNIGRSGMSPKDYSKDVTIDGKKIAIKGATFKSMGDVASQGTGGGIVSSNVEGPTSFVGPGSMDVKIEGKNVQLLGDPMLNNCGPGGSPANSATMMGVIQAPDGLVTAVEDGPCPICKDSHGALNETQATRVDAGALAGNFKKELDAVSARASAMLGVVHCKCGGARYADQSAMTTVEFTKAAAVAGMKHQKGVTTSYAIHGSKEETKMQLDRRYEETLVEMKASIGARLGNSELFQKTWIDAKERARYSDEHRSEAAAYPPGTCAAQKTLVLLLDDGALPGAMTERYFSSTRGKTQAPIRYIDNRAGAREEKVEKFKDESTVPPCGTCEIIVPLLLCPGDKKTCAHKS